ncbi:hypothetical protein B296_00053509 [Ensete ventricosum]|uniref:HD domain-containing protein n=1 Tax=Ensete ventricosum TaxID=4639 RepID=A0A426Y7W1_ENSVE|nr:hypothetical protein B296_00053509 [Ensete ventricosum]
MLWGVSARCSSDHEESRMGAARRARAGVGGRSHVPDGHYVPRVCSKFLCLHIFLYFAAKEIDELWMEYEDNSSPEAKLVKDFDKVHFYMLLSGGVEMILQALEYEDGKSKELTWKNFLSLLQLQVSQVNDAMLKLPVLNFCSTLKCHICFAGKFQTDIGKAWASEIASRRKRGK